MMCIQASEAKPKMQALCPAKLPFERLPYGKIQHVPAKRWLGGPTQKKAEKIKVQTFTVTILGPSAGGALLEIALAKA